MNDVNVSIPWYRLPIVWFLIAVPLSAVVMGVIMITLAIKSDDGLVKDDYYKQGLAINRELSRQRFSQQHMVKADLSINAATGMINLKLKGDESLEYPDELELKFNHATRSDADLFLRLTRGPENQYVGHLSDDLSSGLWNIELGTEQWRIGARLSSLNEQPLSIVLQ